MIMKNGLKKRKRKGFRNEFNYFSPLSSYTFRSFPFHKPPPPGFLASVLSTDSCPQYFLYIPRVNRIKEIWIVFSKFEINYNRNYIFPKREGEWKWEERERKLSKDEKRNDYPKKDSLEELTHNGNEYKKKKFKKKVISNHNFFLVFIFFFFTPKTDKKIRKGEKGR